MLIKVFMTQVKKKKSLKVFFSFILKLKFDFM